MKARKQKNNRILRLVQSKRKYLSIQKKRNHQLTNTYFFNNYKIEIKLNFNIIHDSLPNIIQSPISLQIIIHTHLMNQSSRY